MAERRRGVADDWSWLASIRRSMAARYGERDSTTSASYRTLGRALSIDRLRRLRSMAYDLDDEGRRILDETTDPRLRYPRLADTNTRARTLRSAPRHDAFSSSFPFSLSLSLSLSLYLLAPSRPRCFRCRLRAPEFRRRVFPERKFLPPGEIDRFPENNSCLSLLSFSSRPAISR